MSFIGLRGTGNFGVDERPKNFRELILWLSPNGTAPLTALMAKMKKENLDDPEYSWWEEEQNIPRVQVNGAIASGITALVVDSGALELVAGDLLLHEADDSGIGEIVEVTTDPTIDTAVTITRGASGTAAVAFGDNDYLTKIGNAFAEGTGAPNAANRNPTKQVNYAQIFKTVYDLTETAIKTRYRTGDPLKNDKKRKMFDHSTAMEFAFLFGQAFETTGSNGKPKRYTGGLNSYINTNRTLFGGGTAFTEDNFIDALSPVFDYEGNGIGNERICFAGNGALTGLNKLARNSSSTRINFDGTVKAYGMELQKWILPQGTVFVRTHPLMNTHGRFKNSMFVVNPSGVIYRPFRDTKMKDNIQLPDADSRKGQWLTEAGIEVQHEKTMAYFGNMTI